MSLPRRTEVKTTNACIVSLLFVIRLIVNPAAAQNTEKQTRLPVEGTILVAGAHKDGVATPLSRWLSELLVKDGLRVGIYDLNGRYIFEDSVLRMQTPDGIVWDGKDQKGRNVRPGYYFFRIDASEDPSPMDMTHQTDDLYFWDVTASRMPVDSTYPWDMECGDIDNDGDVDIVIGCQEWSEPGQSRLLLNTGSGTFVDETDSRLPGILAFTNDIDLADIDNDGDLDMYLANSSMESGGFYDRLLVNDGSGFFHNETSVRLPESGAGTYNVDFADIDGDDDRDIISVGYRSQETIEPELRILLNDGGGKFIPAADRTPPLRISLWNVTAVDVDGDQDMDLALSALGKLVRYDEFGNPVDSLSGQNTLLINDGSGWFSDQTEGRVPVDSTISTKRIEIGDIDGDLDIDLFLANTGFNAEQAENRVYINDGQGRFSDETDSRFLEQGAWWSNDADLADIDSDGDLDLFVANVLPGDYAFDELLLNDGTGIFTDRSYLLPEVLDFSTACALSDFDGDTDIDIVTANSLPPTASSHDGLDRLYLNMLVTDTEMPRGDVNNDGQIDVSDVYLCVRIITHTYEPHYPEFLRADLNRDSAVNALDVVSMIRMILQGH